MKTIGPNFPAEIKAAGLAGLSFGWTPDSALVFDAAMTPEKIAAVQAVYAAHDPSKPLTQTPQESIDSLERTDMIPRAVREFMLGSIKKYAQDAGQDPMLLPAYVKLKARDAEIKALRSKL